MPPPPSYLRRLQPEFYQGHAYVHWSMTMANRTRDWLDPDFHLRFREVLLHTTSRYHLAVPAYCLMPDHLHFLAIGLAPDSDQQNATKFLRKHLNQSLAPNHRLQKQPYDHVLTEQERDHDAFPSVAHYILLNPERADLVPEGEWSNYPYLGTIFPGYPSLNPRTPDFWETFWKIVSLIEASP